MASSIMPDEPARQGDTPQQQQQSSAQSSATIRPRPATSTTSESGWFSIPAPLARLFKRFPLLTYPPNELPMRSPQQQRDVATLYVFISGADALKGLPSYNPTCLKWQTFLRLAGIENLQIASSSNHASPNGALPFLIAPAIGGSSSANSAATTSSTTIIPSNKLEQYALSHAKAISSSSSTTDKKKKNHLTISDIPLSQFHRFEAYTSLLDNIRNAWLHALYLNPANTALLRHWYIDPTSSSPAVRTATLYQLRAAAEAEITRSSAHNTLRAIYGSTTAAVGMGEARRGGNKLYTEAREAFSALATCLDEQEDGNEGWFFGAEAPGVFDAAVFAYTHLILCEPAVDTAGGAAAGPGWADRTLADIVREFPSLVRHRDRVYQRCWRSRD